MDGGRSYVASDFISFLENSSNSLWAPSSSSPSFHETMVKFDEEARRLSPQPSDDGEETEMPEKKRRLSPHQVQFLESNFEVENKLEPERKLQLAKDLGLHPRQVAIWFQNRRARFKTKQLEKDYGSLKASYDRLKANFDSLIKERDDLQNEAKSLMKKLKQRDKGPENMDPDNPVRLEEVKAKIEVEKEASKNKVQVEDASSDVLDSESPNCTMDSTQMSDPDRLLDSSPDDEDGHLINVGISLLFPPTPPPLSSNTSLPNLTSSTFSPVDDPSVWSWFC